MGLTVGCFDHEGGSSPTKLKHPAISLLLRELLRIPRKQVLLPYDEPLTHHVFDMFALSSQVLVVPTKNVCVSAYVCGVAS